jgi:hypothetical protein
MSMKVKYTTTYPKQGELAWVAGFQKKKTWDLLLATLSSLGRALYPSELHAGIAQTVNTLQRKTEVHLYNS